MLDSKNIRLVSSLCLTGILGILARRVLVLLTPLIMYESFLPIDVKQKLAMIASRASGLMTQVGGVQILKRCLTLQQVLAISNLVDVMALRLLVGQVCFGLLTSRFSAQPMDGSEMMKLMDWA